MAMTRRSALGWLAAAAAAPLLPVLERTGLVPTRWLEAVRDVSPSRPIRRLDDRRVARPGPWRG